MNNNRLIDISTIVHRIYCWINQNHSMNDHSMNKNHSMSKNCVMNNNTVDEHNVC